MIVKRVKKLKVRLPVLIDPDDRDRLRILAGEEFPVAAHVRIAIKEYLARQEAAARRGAANQKRTG